MKIYNKIIIDIKSGSVIDEDSFEYNGLIAECFGGGGNAGSTVQSPVDPEASLRLTALSEDQWNNYGKPMAEMALKTYAPMEQQMMEGNLQNFNDSRALGSQLSSMAYIDPRERMGAAQAGVMQGVGQASAAASRNFARMGVSANSGRMGGLQQALALESAKGMAGAGTMAARQAESETFSRKGQAMQAIRTGMMPYDVRNPNVYAQGYGQTAVSALTPLTRPLSDSRSTGWNAKFF